jgi:hypothetical protein
MTRKKSITVGLAVLAFGIYAVMTGGIAVSLISDFGGQRNILLVRGLKSDVWLAPKSTNLGIPFIFHYYRACKPFGLRLQIWDANRQYRTVEISEAVVKYKDGDVVRLASPWSRSLKPYTQYNSSSSGIVQTPMYMLSDEMEGLVMRHADLTITLKGHLVTADGERVEFEVSESFQALSRSDVSTFWDVLAGC